MIIYRYFLSHKLGPENKETFFFFFNFGVSDAMLAAVAFIAPTRQTHENISQQKRMANAQWQKHAKAP